MIRATAALEALEALSAAEPRARTASERRAHARFEGAALAWVNRVRLKYGPAVSVIDLSAGGAQIEATHGLRPGSSVVIEIAGGKHHTTMPSRVVRCEVADIASAVRYRGALEFKRPLALGGAGPKPAAPRPTGHVAGWHCLVARFRDGRILKGYGRNFTPARGHVQIEAVPDGPAVARIVVRLAHLKALFFVHDFDGLKSEAEPALPTTQARGRPIVVTFFDGEVMTGTTLNYSAAGPGFFMSPVDAQANNHRLFVVSSAVQRVEFP